MNVTAPLRMHVESVADELQSRMDELHQHHDWDDEMAYWEARQYVLADNVPHAYRERYVGLLTETLAARGIEFE